MRENTRTQGVSKSVLGALDHHLVACAAVASAAVAGGLSETSHAAIIYSGTKNLALPAGTGLYINIVTSQSGDKTAKPAGWDINPYVGSTVGTSDFGMYCPSSTGVVGDSSSSFVSKLPAGATIGAASSFIGFGTYPGAPLMAGNNTGNWYGASTGTDFMGVQFVENSATYYGWVRINKTAGNTANSNITIVDWAYDNTGASIAAGVPEPSSLALLAAGAVGLMVRRGRAKLRAATV